MRARSLIIASLTCLTAAPSVATGQSPTSASREEVQARVRDLALLVDAERQQLAELQIEIERRTTALSQIAAQLEALGAPPAPQPVAAAAPSPPVDATPQRFDFYGETLTRFALLTQGYPGCVACEPRPIGRLRLRFGAEGHLAPGLNAVLGLGIGELNDPNTVYQTLGGKFSRKVATWDRGYLNYQPVQAPWMDLTAGKFPYTWLRSSMTFDVDFYPEGASERFPFELHDSGPLKNVTVQGLQLVLSEQPTGPDAMVIGGQLTGRVQAGRTTSVVAFTGMDIKRPEYLLRAQLSGADVGTRNTNEVVVEAGQPFYASGFRYANVIAESTIRTRWESQPLTLGLEYQRNLRAASDRNTGVSFRLDAGRRQKRGDWGFGWHAFRLEQDAIVAALGESDWRAPTNVIQHRFFVNRVLHQNVQAIFTWYRGRTLDRSVPGALVPPGLPANATDPWANRWYLDVMYRF